MTEPKPDSGSVKVVKKVRRFLPKPDNRRNEWSPLPSGIIIACFTAPVAVIFLVGVVIDTDPSKSPVYGFLAFVLGAVTVFAAGDASYIAGMRRIADQDLRYKGDRESSRERARPVFEPPEPLDAFADKPVVRKAKKDEPSRDSYS